LLSLQKRRMPLIYYDLYRTPTYSYAFELWYNYYTWMRFHFDTRKSRQLRANPKRGIGFEEAQEIFMHPYYLDRRSDVPEQYRAIGWVGEQLYSLIFEVREDAEGEYYHLVTLWRATKEEQRRYEEYS
jgi:uncharacterized DUF497 family protein